MNIEEVDSVVVWFGYVDESGTHGTSSHVVVGSVIGHGRTWQAVALRWKAILKSYSLSYYHAVEFNRGTGECEKLTEQERVNCVKELIQTISNADLEYIVYALERTLFESKKSKLSVYDYLLATTIGDLMRRAEAAEINDMYVFIEDGCELSTTLCNLLMKAASARKLGAVGNISYLKKDHPHLQVADMIAYDSFKYLDNLTIDSSKAMRRSFQKIMEGNPFSYYLLNNAVLEVDLPIAEAFLNGILNR